MPSSIETNAALPIAIIGAGPVGLAAAAQLTARGLRPLVIEAGAGPGAAVRQWGHVRMFSPWRFNVDAAARALLEGQGWKAPPPASFPTGNELVADYVEPLARALSQAGVDLHYGARVTGISRRHHDRLHDGAPGRGRAEAPFVLQVEGADGHTDTIEARAVIDATGTWSSPNPASAHGLPAPGETPASAHIRYGIPDVLGADRATYAEATTLVLGGGHSAMNTVLDLVKLGDGARILWAFRRPLGAVNFGGGAADGLAARGALGARAQSLVEAGRIEALAPFLVHRIEQKGGRLEVQGEREGQAASVTVDRLIVATGFRPDLSMLGELRLDLDRAVQATPALAPLIDPNLHSCGTVRPHGEAELRHPGEPGFYMAGMKSYGRAPTFLLATGHEQVRSIAAYLAGDLEAARRVELELPETGVCSASRPVIEIKAPAAAGSCCAASPAPAAKECCG
ncbi:FAD-dependent oxidoreductase [Roseococcus pinisoli]|uniref:NAD(P)-binding domain-containing protein n=1 Tax=Roseococcus pinisoli TaxID=2835040 RepID=A0ABS5QHT8_9PROT|nr:FAD-dependent oxidoreductase [Roseococcus pinisoli]MBS7813265.1 NAD(P)-binding domain-containing protein [Roseococcus pinisoli]